MIGGKEDIPMPKEEEEGRTDLYGTWAHKIEATQKSTVTLAGI